MATVIEPDPDPGEGLDVGGLIPELPPREVGDPRCGSSEVFDGSWEMGIAEKAALLLKESISALGVVIEVMADAWIVAGPLPLSVCEIVSGLEPGFEFTWEVRGNAGIIVLILCGSILGFRFFGFRVGSLGEVGFKLLVATAAVPDKGSPV